MKALALWLLAAVALLGGCAQGRPLNLGEFRATCWAMQTPRCVRGDVCTEYRNQMDQAFATLDACLAVCRETGARLSKEYMLSSCQGVAVGTASQCERYCRRNYGAKGPLFPPDDIR